MTPNYKELEIIYQPVDALKSNPRNTRTHSKRQIGQIAQSIKAFGFINPLIVDKNNTVWVGNGKLQAANRLKMSKVPTICLEDLSPEQLIAYAIADNRLAEKAGWDVEILRIELQNLLEIETVFDITVTGFEIPEIDLLLSPGDQKRCDDDVVELDVASEPVAQLGDIWQLGKHRISCGNAIDEAPYSSLLGTKRAAVVFIDPPYNVRIHGHATGNGAIRHREFPMAAGEMDDSQYIDFLISSLKLLVRYSLAGSVHFVCNDWRRAGELATAGKQVYSSLLNVCVWVKNTGGMGSFYRSRHEFVFVFRNGERRHRNNIQLGRFGRNRTNVWEYPSINTSSKSGDEGNLLALHPTVKPVALIADALLDCSARGDIVLDAFLGSGSTLIAAERTGRVCYGIELDPLYVDTAIRRWQRHTGDHAIHVGNGKRFDEVANECLGVVHG